jgi:hypothetical protein
VVEAAEEGVVEGGRGNAGDDEWPVDRSMRERLRIPERLIPNLCFCDTVDASFWVAAC